MEIPQGATLNKEQILQAFQELLSEHEQGTSKISTKQEAAEREEDKKIVEKASRYTVESIVKGMADLQLNFGKSIDNLTEQLVFEAPKLEELRRAIRVETQRVTELRNIRVVADALDILIQGHQDKMKIFEAKSQQERQTLDQEIVEEIQTWQKEQQEFEAALKARQELVTKDREQREADYQYEVERKRKIDADEYADRKTTLERQITEEDTKREADWIEREKVIGSQQETLATYKILVDSFPQELEEATQKAKEEAMNEVYETANVQAELFEKELEADKEVSTLKLASLQETTKHQAAQIDQLSSQLQAALKQIQELAVRAVGGTGKIERSV